MFVRVRRLPDVLQTPDGRARHRALIALGAALTVVAMAGAARAQSEVPAGSPPPGYAPPAAPPGSGGPSNYPPSSYPPPGYPSQPGYPPNQAQQGQPPSARPPSYGQPPGSGGYNEPQTRGYNEPPLPPPPKRRELEWSIRFQLLNLLFGRVTGEVEYAFAGPFSVVLLPEYVFNQPIDNRPGGLTAKGGGLAAQFAFWVEGRPLRGYFLKAHAGYRSVTVTGPLDEIAVPATEVGAMFGSQSVYGGWFTLSGGFGVVYDLQSKDRPFTLGYDSTGRPVGAIRASGLFGNGFDLLGQLSIGGSF
jgi:hypothetical protein